MNELQQLFAISSEERDFRGIIRLYRHFDGHWIMEATVDLSDESTASRKVLEWRDDKAPRLLVTDLKTYQLLLMNEVMLAVNREIPEGQKKLGFKSTVNISDILDFNEMLIQREAEKRSGDENSNI